jgi:hypothetical protein
MQDLYNGEMEIFNKLTRKIEKNRQKVTQLLKLLKIDCYELPGIYKLAFRRAVTLEKQFNQQNPAFSIQNSSKNQTSLTSELSRDDLEREVTLEGDDFYFDSNGIVALKNKILTAERNFVNIN